MSDARSYARGFLAGQTTAVIDELVAYKAEALVLVALRELGASPTESKTILEQARHDAHMAVPDLTEFAGRLIAAEMLIAILRQRLASMSSEVAA